MRRQPRVIDALYARVSLEELGDKVDASEKESIESAVAELEEAVKGDDLEAINAKTEAVTQVSHKLAEQMYAQAQSESTEQPGDDADRPADDDVVDAEFEEVDDEDKKS